MKLRHDAEADAVYIQLSRQKYEFGKTWTQSDESTIRLTVRQ